MFQEYQSFTDLQFSKEKRITCIQWHPTIKGWFKVTSPPLIHTSGILYCIYLPYNGGNGHKPIKSLIIN